MQSVLVVAVLVLLALLTGATATTDLTPLVEDKWQECALDGTWEDIKNHRELVAADREEPRYYTGGLGNYTDSKRKVWLCDRRDSCALTSPASLDMMCYAYNEVSRQFEPLALNSKLRFVRRRAAQHNCVAGEYSMTVGSDVVVCQACPPNSNAPVGSDESTDCTCNPGSTRKEGGACVMCVLGKYKIMSGDALCVNCVAGKYSTTVGSDVCHACPPNSTSLVGSSVSTACTCNAGSTGPDGGACSRCVAGKYKLASGSATCTDCVNGTYSDAVGANRSSACLACPAHSVSPAGSVAAAACACSAGATGPDGGACVLCLAGKYKVAPGAAVCVDCVAGKYSTTDHALCQTCPQNSNASAQSDEPSDCTCNPGSTGPDGGTCLLCVEGKFKAGSGNSACDSCPNPLEPYSPVGSILATVCHCHVPGIELGLAESFAVLAGTGFTDTGVASSTINGDMGINIAAFVFPGYSTGSPGHNGNTHSNDAPATNARIAVTAAIAAISSRTECLTAMGGVVNLAGRTLKPGLYTSTSTFHITSGNLILDAGMGDTDAVSDAVFIFRTPTTLTLTAGSKVILTGGASSKNVYWSLGTAATFYAGSIMEGDLFTLTAITYAANVIHHGRALALTMVALLGTTIGPV